MRVANLALTLVLLVMSCQKPKQDQPPAGPADFTIITGPSSAAIDPNSRSYVMLHGTDGRLLQTIEFHQGDTINYFAPADRKDAPISISFFSQLVVANNRIIAQIHTYLNNPLRQIWHLNRQTRQAPDISKGNNTGQFIFNYFPDKKSMPFMSTPYEASTIGYTSGPPEKFTHYGTIFDKVPSYFFLLYADGEDPRYLTLDRLKNDSTYNYSSENLRRFDRYLQVEAPGSNDLIGKVTTLPFPQFPAIGMKTSDTELGRMLGNEPAPKTIRLGYLDSISTYFTQITAHTATGSQFYTHAGGIPAPPQFPFQETVAVTDKKFNHFTYEMSGDLKKWEGLWTYRDNPLAPTVSFDWYVFGGKDVTLSLLELPSEWTSTFPGFSLSQLEYQHAFFFVEGRDYATETSNSFALRPDTLALPYTIRKIQVW